jgi:hypothetical protein
LLHPMLLRVPMVSIGQVVPVRMEPRWCGNIPHTRIVLRSGVALLVPIGRVVLVPMAPQLFADPTEG